MKAGLQQKKLGDVCEITSALIDPRLDKYLNLLHVGGANIESTSGRLIDLRTAEEESLISGKFLFDESMVLYSKIRPYLMKVARPNFQGICSADIYPLSAKRNVIDRDYLFHVLLSPTFTEYANKGSARAGMPKVNRDYLFSYELELPPLPEQKRIVSILDEAFEGIAKAKANADQSRKNARTFFESHLESVFRIKGEGWTDLSLDEAVDADCSLSYGIVQPGDEFLDGLPIIRPTDLGTRIIELNGLKRIDPSLADSYRRTTLRGGDLLLCVRGSTGGLSIASASLIGGNVTRGIVPIYFEKSLVSQSFGYFLLLSPPVQEQIREKTYGTALMQINIGDLRKIILPVPPLQMQQELEMKFNEILMESQRLESIYRQKITALDELKKSLLHKAFSGEL